MLQNRKVRIIVALIMSVCLWAYVTGTIDPTITKKYNSVPITIINEDSLIQDDLAVDSVSATTVDLTLSGARGDLSDLDADDIQVTVDLYGRHKGNNYVSIDVQVPKGISIDNKSIEKIEVVIDDLVTAEKDVKATVKGSLPESTTLGETKIEPESVMVYGTKDNVDKVSYLKASLNADKLSDDSTTIETAITPVNSKGNEVEYVNLSRSKVEVTAVLAKYKEVKLEVKKTGKIDSQYEVSSMTIPETVEIEGEASVIKNIDTIEASDVDISKVTKSTKIEIKPILPEGVTLKNEDEKLYVDIIIKSPKTKILSYENSEIEIKGLDDGLTGEILEGVNVTVSGKESDISDITKKSFTLSVDASNLEEGKHSVKVNITSKNDDVSTELSNGTVTLEIGKE